MRRQRRPGRRRRGRVPPLVSISSLDPPLCPRTLKRDDYTPRAVFLAAATDQETKQGPYTESDELCSAERQGFSGGQRLCRGLGSGRRGLPRANAVERGCDARARLLEARASLDCEGAYHRA